MSGDQREVRKLSIRISFAALLPRGPLRPRKYVLESVHGGQRGHIEGVIKAKRQLHGFIDAASQLAVHELRGLPPSGCVAPIGGQNRAGDSRSRHAEFLAYLGGPTSPRPRLGKDYIPDANPVIPGRPHELSLRSARVKLSIEGGKNGLRWQWHGGIVLKFRAAYSGLA